MRSRSRAGLPEPAPLNPKPTEPPPSNSNQRKLRPLSVNSRKRSTIAREVEAGTGRR